ncbi:MAG TPA: hypothetical protein VIU61_16640 [Kofleriaceae bacterium]
MATKKTDKAKPAKKPVAKKTTIKKPPKGEKKQVVAKPRHPRARVLEAHGGKDAIAKSLAAVIARADQDTDQLEAQLKKASNSQLLRLTRVTATVKQKYGNRDKLIAAIGTAEKKSKDKDFIAKLETYSLPQLLDLATAAERRARA